jgi:hypothetical protein
LARAERQSSAIDITIDRLDGAIGIVSIAGCQSCATVDMTFRHTPPDIPRSRTRRRLLGRLAAGGLIASQAAAATELLKPLEVAPSSRVPGAPILEHPYGVPSSYEAQVVRRSARAWPLPGAASSMTPLADLHGAITPNGLFYERHHNGVPDIDPDQHRLAIHGLVRTPKLFTMDDLLRLPSESRIHFLECSGNTGNEWNGQCNSRTACCHAASGLACVCRPCSTKWEACRVPLIGQALAGYWPRARTLLR